jgi:hypothetical protein
MQSSDKDAASRGTSLPSTQTVRSIAPIALTQAFNIIRIAYIPDVIKRANPMSLFSSAADKQRLASIVEATDRLFDRCGETIRCERPKRAKMLFILISMFYIALTHRLK